jgi:hypothetical protein
MTTLKDIRAIVNIPVRINGGAQPASILIERTDSFYRAILFAASDRNDFCDVTHSEYQPGWEIEAIIEGKSALRCVQRLAEDYPQIAKLEG